MQQDRNQNRPHEHGLIRRTFKNAGLLLSGKGTAAVLGLAYIALTAQVLGAETFGTLVLIHAYALLISEITTFKSWQAVIRYGADAVSQGNSVAFQSLVKFTTMLDLGAALAGTIIAALAVPFVAPFLGWNAAVQDMALLYTVLILFSIKATPVGLLRLFDRFDLIAMHSLVMPLLRLSGVIVAWIVDASLWGFVVVWLCAGIISGMLLLALGWYEFHRRGYTKGLGRDLKGLTRSHEGIWKFVWIANLNATLELATSHAATLLAGLIVGQAGAGIFKIAQESSNILAKPTGLFTQSIYPELAKLSSTGERQSIWRVAQRSGVIAGAGASAILIVVALIGKPLLALVFGPEYVAAYPVLLFLILSGALSMAGFALSPAMFAIGRPDIPFKVKAGTSALHVVAAYYLLSTMGIVGAGVAAAASALATLVAMLIISLKVLTRASPAAPAE